MQYLFNCFAIFAIVGSIEVNSLRHCSPVPGDCSFYKNCLEANVPCGEKGYAVAYGSFVCNTCLEHLPQFTSHGQEFIQGTMTCLQEALDPIANHYRKMGCEELKTYAFNSHPLCFADEGICDLPVPDIARLLFICFEKLNDLRAFRSVTDTALECGMWKFVELLEVIGKLYPKLLHKVKIIAKEKGHEIDM